MGGQRAQDYLALNPQGLVPALALDEGAVLTQSLAIVEYLDETHPEPPLLPADPIGRARVRAIALSIACDIHPLDNLRVLNYLIGTLGVAREQKDGWYRYWIDVGFEALEKALARDRARGRFCHGDAPTLADVCLVPQMANARRFDIDLSPYPTLMRIESACLALPAFADAAPARQPDAE
jgi:maleylacetoacetate isomerase